MKQESKRLTSIILAALILAAALVAYFEFIVPSYTNLETVKGQEESEQALLANENQIVTQGKALLATYQNDASSSQSVALALPVGQDVSGALAQIYGIASNANVTVQGTAISIQAVQATPAAVQTDGSTGSQLGNAAATGSIVKPTGTISFQVTGSGSYESIKAFLQELETNIRIFNVTAIALQPTQTIATKTQAASSDVFNYTITVVTYYQAP
jgi:Tfp pilus assembly protein PilO